MSAGNVSHRINQRQHHQAKGQRDANVRDGAVAYVVDHNCPGAGEDEEKRPEQFPCQYLHFRVESVTCGKRPSIARQEATRLQQAKGFTFVPVSGSLRLSIWLH